MGLGMARNIINEWTEVLVKAEDTCDMTYSFPFVNQFGQQLWGTKVRPLPGARNFLAGAGLKKNIDYDYTADRSTGEYCYKFENPYSAVLFKMWFDKDSPKKTSSKSHQKCPECGHTF